MKEKLKKIGRVFKEGLRFWGPVWVGVSLGGYLINNLWGPILHGMTSYDLDTFAAVWAMYTIPISITIALWPRRAWPGCIRPARWVGLVSTIFAIPLYYFEMFTSFSFRVRIPFIPWWRLLI